jgi:hypothetical protein
MPRPPRRQPPVRQRLEPIAIDPNRPPAWPIEPAQQVQQRRLARPRRPHKREELARLNPQIDPLKHPKFLGAAAVDLFHVDYLDVTSSFDRGVRNRRSDRVAGQLGSRIGNRVAHGDFLNSPVPSPGLRR